MPRVYQVYLDDTLFTGITAPTAVNGLSFRLPGSANTSYPLSDLTFAQYDISLDCRQGRDRLRRP